MGLFGKNTGNTLANVLGTIGDALMMREGMGPVYTPLRMQRREDDEKRRREEEQAARMQQALQGIGRTPQEIDAIMAGAGDYLPKETKPATQQDNAGNVWAKDPKTGEWRVDFIDPTPKIYNQGSSVVNVPNPLFGRNPRDIPPIGSRVSAGDIFGGATTANTPAPQVGENGMPSVLTRQQYEATVNAMGRQQTDDWMRRNNIRLGD